MLRTRHVSYVLLCAVVGTMVGCGTNMQKPAATNPASAPQTADGMTAGQPATALRHVLAAPQVVLPNGFTITGTDPGANTAAGAVFFRNALGVPGNPLTAGTFKGFPTGLDAGVKIQTNGRSCATCHQAGDNFALTPRAANRARNNDPLIREVLADAVIGLPNTPDDNALILLRALRRHALIRVAMPAPLPALNGNRHIKTFRAVPPVASAAFTRNIDLTDVDGNPVDFFVMWDGREHSLEEQAGSATLGHAQAVFAPGSVIPLSGGVRGQLDKQITKDIAKFQRQLGLGLLGGNDPTTISGMGLALITPATDVSQFPVVPNGLGENIIKHLPQYVADKFIANPGKLPDAVLKDLHEQYVPQLSFNSLTQREKDGFRAFVGTKQKPGCIVCHNVPGTLGGGTVQFEDVAVSRENKHRLPTDRIWLKGPGPNDYVRKRTPDAGLALRTGKLEHFEKFKVPGLLNIKEMDRFFHDNHEASIGNMINHYREAFPTLFELNNGEKRDMRAYLERL